MIPANVLGRMRATKALLTHKATPPHEAAAARAMYDRLVAKYGDPDANPNDDLRDIPIWRPSSGWKAEVLSRQAGVAQSAYEWLYRRNDLVIVPASTLGGPAATGWIISKIFPEYQEPQHYDQQMIISLAISLGFRCEIAVEDEYADFERQARADRAWFDRVNTQPGAA